MKPTRAARVVSVLFLVGATALAIAYNAARPRVLILHSYDPDYAWTRDVDEGIRRVAKEWSDYSVARHYMNTHNLSDPDSLRFAGIGARRAIDRFGPTVVIAVDDPAQKLAARFYIDRPGLSIVFTGVNGSVEPYGYDRAGNVTGIFERKPMQAVKELVLTLERERGTPDASPSVLYLMDPSPSMASDRPFVESFDWAPVRFLGAVVAPDFARWRERVLAINPDEVDYLLIANYRQLPRSADDPAIPRPGEIMAWTEANSPVPVIGFNVFNVEDGAAIAVGASPFEQGEMAAKLAERILEEERPASEIPQLYNRHYVIAMNARALRERNLHLPQIYETFARTTFTFIEGEP